MASSAFFHGKRVSHAHKTILDEAERRGILHAINQGRRTLAEQAVFYAAYLRGGTLAAFPSPSAPHIKWGRANHALDVNAPEPNGALTRFYKDLGVPVVHNVPSEAWHMDFPDEHALVHAASSLRERGGLLVTLKPGARHNDVRHARQLLLEGGSKLRIPKTMKRHYGRAMVREVKRIQRNNNLRPDGVIGPKTWQRLRGRAERKEHR